MVEIMLAVIVIALGLTSTFVLFPVGLNASKDALAANQSAEISEMALAIIKSELLPEIISNDAATGYKFEIGSDAAGFKFVDAPGETGLDNSNPDLNVDNLPEGLKKYGSSKGLYTYKSDNFSAAIKVYLDKSTDNPSGFHKEYFFSVKKSGEKETYDHHQYSEFESEVNINDFLLPVAVEVSWPLHLPIEERKKQIYRFEIFNDKYDAKPQTPAS